MASISPTQPSRLLCQFCGGCFPQARTFDSIMCLHEHPLSGSPYILGFPCPNFLFRGALAICCLSLPRFNSCSAINILSLPKDKHQRIANICPHTQTHKRTALAEAQRKKLLHTLAGMLKAARVGLVGGGGGAVVWPNAIALKVNTCVCMRPPIGIAFEWPWIATGVDIRIENRTLRNLG